MISASYPYEKEQTFIEPELKYLVAAFDRVIVLPRLGGGDRVSEPEGVEVIEDFVRTQRGFFGSFRIAWRALFTGLFWKEAIRYPLSLLHPRALARLVVTAGTAGRLKDWLVRWIASGEADPDRLVLYSYWLGPATLGAGLVKDRYPGIRLISRAHGADVYEHRKTPPYFPCREEYIRRTDRIYSVSEAGRRHLAEQYPKYADRMRTAYLGVSDPGAETPPSTDGVFRIVSCSFMTAVKRLPLLTDGLRCLAERHPDRKFEWHHIGGGGGLEHLQARAAELPENITCRFEGSVPPGGVLDYYRHHAVDVFVNVSRSEGVPVSIMEARSFGIPVVATAVGGIPEISTDEDSILLDPNPSADDIAAALWRYFAEPDEIKQGRRKASRRMWSERSNEQVNYTAYARDVRALIGG